jgi:hypothetical protein
MPRAKLVNSTNLHIRLQQVLEVQVLLVRHILQTVLAVDFFSSFVEVAAHGVVDKISRQTGGFTLVLLLLLHPCDEEDLSNDDTPENAPNRQDAFESIYLEVESA